MENIKFTAFVVSEVSEGVYKGKITEQSLADLPPNEVTIRVHYSSLNYKDALSASGNRGVSRVFPHTPGIDASGIVIHSDTDQYKSGDQVLVTGYDLGMNTPGGFGEIIRVPANWIVPLPQNLDLMACMTIGTAGFTAALAMHHLLRCGQQPSNGPLLITGATGGVGSFSVWLASHLGFEVVAASGKPHQTEYLKTLGAASVIDRTAINDTSNRFLLRGRWGGAIDTVGGNILATILKSVLPHGNIAVCGNVSSPLLHTSVFPFILNGANLLGVNSATTPMPLRVSLWDKLSSEWKPNFNLLQTKQIDMQQLDENLSLLLLGNISGRVVLSHNMDN